ncbi:50S ribosomal protein L21 [Candidatus Adlerbacteria bacterium RIFCSPHIGHO2_01_FULL_54_23]|uniref:50S ribosomal protein L21 n=3 Tax=Candidatus Adleribacteriota TaxID=1752736 RepID=A0A1F4Y0X3_9BACT|nr:MAG: 50S ribosomal protein L21 [Candidatus Adlerbacteria bacterium GW2011_GWA1_54_10]KKW37937.1 MAG: 50S ribosomal protein L21 [Candidatus Adlerbacteria bacterium GW2011_GWB1_54_7]OGC78620.1 MAG: 50S ribosomal protein L21 [Candidatus Adlerbacteria bacterium RIFCSPHIGHO2_01_FULL_54_23]OGC87627.1 MAG: 50S ribosomal protein L21 [Candidatus Adlerbacteria bacterium RIFCSPLOWO2_01_FULL_54_16]
MVSEGDTIKIEKIRPRASSGHACGVGDSVVFDKIILTDNGKDTSIGQPYVEGAKVTGEIKKISRAKKVTVIKYKAKSNYFKKRGHRQPFFEVTITKLA